MTRFLLLLLAALLLSACGFHLRGTGELPMAMKKVRIVGLPPSDPLLTVLTTTLIRSGAQVISDSGVPVIDPLQQSNGWTPPQTTSSEQARIAKLTSAELARAYEMTPKELARVFEITPEELTRAKARQEEAQNALIEAVVLQVGTEISTRTISLNRTGLAYEFDLIYRLSYEIKTATGEVIEPKQKVKLNREQYTDQFLITARGEEEVQLRQEMLAEAAEILTNRLSYLLKNKYGNAPIPSSSATAGEHKETLGNTAPLPSSSPIFP